MAWNRPSGNGEAASSPLLRKGGASAIKRRGRRFPIVAATLVVLGAAVAAWWLWPQRERGEDTVSTTPTSLIREVTPAAAPKAKVHERFRPPSLKTKEEKLAFYRKIFGNDIPENLKPTLYFIENPAETGFEPSPRPEDIFHHHSERTIAAVLLMQPGAFMMGRPQYDEDFDDDFRKSLKEPTLVTKDDTPEQQELKRAVNETKAELAERMRRGEKPSDIMNAVMNDAYELGKYKRNVEELLQEYESDATKSDQDVRDFVAAVNIMLKDKGADPVAEPELLHRKARLRIEAREREKLQNEKKEKEQ